VGGESTIKSWGYLAWIDAHDGGCSLGGLLLVAEDAEIEALYVLPGSARPRDRGSPCELRLLGKANGSVTHVGQAGVDATRTAVPLDHLRASAKDHGTYEVASYIRWPPAYIWRRRIGALSPA